MSRSMNIGQIVINTLDVLVSGYCATNQQADRDKVDRIVDHYLQLVFPDKPYVVEGYQVVYRNMKVLRNNYGGGQQ